MQFNIKGGNLPVVICNVQQDETLITERGSMCWMSPNMQMETSSNGGIGKMFGRMFSGESIFQNRYTARRGPGLIAFASSFPGTIIPMQISPSNEIICQKRAFLASESHVDLSIHFQKKFGSGFFGGEGFIMQKLSGNGMAFIEIDGSLVEYDLAPGQAIVVDTGYLAAMSTSCKMNIQQVPGLKNMIFGGEGIFNTVIQGPGHVWLQTMPITSVAHAINPYIVTTSN